ncbi:MAG: FAD-dependent monooxygenase [bacterium]
MAPGQASRCRVVGAGPVGLLLAIELELGGAGVIVLERLTAPNVAIRGTAVGPLGAEALQQPGDLEIEGARILVSHERRHREAWRERMERSVEVLAIILFGAVGLSHILQPKAWAQFFILLRGKGEAGVFVDGLLNLPVAAIIIGFHNVWSGIPAVLTLVGWGLLIKSLIRLCAPALALRMLARVSVERSWEFRVAGFGLLVLAGLLGYGVSAG